MAKPKDKDWLNEYKNKTPIYSVYKRPTSKQDTYRLKVKGWEKIFHPETKRKQESQYSYQIKSTFNNE